MAAAPLILTRTFLALLFAWPATAALADYQPPRTAGGKPDMSGVWQVLNTAVPSQNRHR